MPPVLKWMTQVDQQILDWMGENDVATPKVVWLSVRKSVGRKDAPSYTQIKRRLRKLSSDDVGLITKSDDPEASGAYTLTELGVRFINDNLSDDEVDRLRDAGITD